eukprot:TRINITY_DN3538_c0_g1_i13.p1 TRINITY_DN3538_c0_g1~~TRINITY_DN3538_c0_g1_i13.p1  ORF type:complete len:791 (+),score=89.77 TRINITY_DN3538_c0_g1_i13:189-2561(+)
MRSDLFLAFFDFWGNRNGQRMLSCTPLDDTRQPSVLFRVNVVKFSLMLELSCLIVVMIWSWSILYVDLLAGQEMATDEWWHTMGSWVTRVAAGLKLFVALLYYALHTAASCRLFACRFQHLCNLFLDVSLLVCQVFEPRGPHAHMYMYRFIYIYIMPVVCCIGVLRYPAYRKWRTSLVEDYARLSNQEVDLTFVVGSSFRNLRKGSTYQLVIFSVLSLVDALLVGVVQTWIVGCLTVSITRGDVEMAKYQLIAYIGSYLLDGFTYLLQARSSSVCLAASTACLQRRVAAGMLSMGASEHRSHPSGSINATFSSDLARLDSLWQAFFWAWLSTLTRIVVAVVYTLYLNPPVGVLAFTVFPLIFSTIPQSHSSAAAAKEASASSATISMFQNGVSVQRMIWSCEHQEQWLCKFFDPLVAVQQQANDQSKYTGGLVQAYAAQLVTLFAGVHIAIFGWLAVNDVMTVSQLTEMFSIFACLSGPVRMLAGFFRTAVTMAGSVQRVDEFVSETEPALRRVQENAHCPAELKLARVREGKCNYLSVSNVSFAYPQAMKLAISNVSLCFQPGQFVAVLGGSGCGKSTLLSLIMTWLTPSRGCIGFCSSNKAVFEDVPTCALDRSESTIGSTDFSKEKQRALRTRSAVVFQTTMLFHSTLHDNIAFGAPPTTKREDVEWAAGAAGIIDFIATLSEGFDTELGGAGSVSLSGGQAQRICIARALCRKPSLLLLDEATSALDQETENHILHTMSTLRSVYPEEFESLIIISITHHPDTLRYADVVVRLQDGEVAYCGPPLV